MWIRPSMPGSTSRKAPKSVMLVILPVDLGARGGSVCLKISSGWGKACFRPREMRLEVGLTSRMLTVTSSPELEQLLGVDHLARPGQVGDVDQALDALLELDEGAEVGQAGDLAGDPAGRPCTSRRCSAQGSGVSCLRPRRDLLVLLVEVEDDDLDLLAGLQDFRGVADLAPGHVGDVEQAFDAADVDEGAEAGQRPDVALELLALLDRGRRPCACFFSRSSIEEELAGDDGVLGLAVELMTLNLKVWPMSLSGSLTGRMSACDSGMKAGMPTLTCSRSWSARRSVPMTKPPWWAKAFSRASRAFSASAFFFDRMK